MGSVINIILSSNSIICFIFCHRHYAVHSAEGFKGESVYSIYLTISLTAVLDSLGHRAAVAGLNLARLTANFNRTRSDLLNLTEQQPEA